MQAFCADYDAFQDLPFCAESVYVACGVKFPSSKFILTIRDEEAWFDRLVRFHEKVFGFEDETRVSPEHFKDQALVRHDWSRLHDKDFRIRRYRARNEQIQRYFANRPRDLLVIDVTKETDTGRIADFLELAADQIRKMPRKNVTAVI